MIENDNILYFVNDDDFAVFCIDPQEIITSFVDQNGVVNYGTKYEFSKMYNDALASGKRFCIQDINSHVNKDGYLGFRNATFKIDNIERYYGED